MIARRLPGPHGNAPSHNLAAEIGMRRDLLRATSSPSLEQWLAVTPQTTRDLLASFQRTVIEELLRRAAVSAESIGAATTFTVNFDASCFPACVIIGPLVVQGTFVLNGVTANFMVL